MNEMLRYDIINKLIKKINAKTYLEIGLDSGGNFIKIECEEKFSVDPADPEAGGDEWDEGQYVLAKPTHIMTSDEFFLQNTKTFDLIFVDGLHHAHQIEKDINNALDCLNEGGFVVCHDMSPTSVEGQAVPRAQACWTGDCWKAWVKIRSENSNLSMYVIDTDWGVGVIQRGNQELINLEGQSLEYSNLEKNRQKWLNLISIEQFNETYE
jgi:SAM-dependent methyltransferase